MAQPCRLVGRGFRFPRTFAVASQGKQRLARPDLLVFPTGGKTIIKTKQGACLGRSPARGITDSGSDDGPADAPEQALDGAEAACF